MTPKATSQVLPLTPDQRHSLVTPNTFRWLYNESMQIECRSHSYDLNALVSIAVTAVGATACLSIEKLEAGNNDLLTMTTDTGINVIARIPFGTGGPPKLATLSEVATLDFLRNHVGLPVPRVVAWSASTTEIGTEYIIYEKISGKSMSNLDIFNPSTSMEVITKYCDAEAKLSKIAFSQFGSLFYKEHVDHTLQSRPLYAQGASEDDASRKFRVGPSVDRTLYRAGRAKLNIDRGPWPDVESYLRSRADCEVAWITENRASTSVRLQAGDDLTPSYYLAALNQWKNVFPLIVPDNPAWCTPILWHPDSHAGNVLVAPENDGVDLTGIIDWQGACIRPFFEQVNDPLFLQVDKTSLKYVSMPDEVKLPEFPTGYWQLPQDEQKKAQKEFWSVVALMAFRSNIAKANLDVYAAAQSRNAEFARDAKYFISYMWNIGPIPLVHWFTRLEELLDTQVFRMTEEDGDILLSATRELDFEAQLKTSLNAAMAENGITLGEDGRVLATEFEAARSIAETTLRQALEGAKSEDERKRIMRWWPIREGRASLSAETCA